MGRAININMIEFNEKGQQIFKQISPQLEIEHRGEIVAIEVDTKDFFLARTVHEALKKAKEKYPGKIFYLGKVGYRAVRKRGSHHLSV